MLNIGELSKPVQCLGVVLIAVLATAALYLSWYKGISDQNRTDQERLQARLIEVGALRKYENSLPDLDRQIAALEQQLEIEKRIVPDEQEADQFMHLMQNTAQSSGIEIRRWTAKGQDPHEFYTEVPFDLELDGPYYSLLHFFEKVATLERIINVSNLHIESLAAKGSHKYQYSPVESVAGTCKATTFFSHDHAAVAAGKPGAVQANAK